MGRGTDFVGRTDGLAEGVPGLGPFLGRLEPVRGQEQLLDVDEAALSRRDGGADLFGGSMQPVRQCQHVRVELLFQPHFDVILDDEMQRASQDAQDQTCEFWCHPFLWSGPPAIVMGSELGRVQGVILMIGAV